MCLFLLFKILWIVLWLWSIVWYVDLVRGNLVFNFVGVISGWMFCKFMLLMLFWVIEFDCRVFIVVIGLIVLSCFISWI